MFNYVDKGWVDASAWFVVTEDDVTELVRRHEYDELHPMFHEVMHFYQAISTNFLFWFSASFAFTEGALLNLFAVLFLKEQTFEDALKSPSPLGSKTVFDKLVATLTSDQAPISTLDVIEGNAEHFAYRALWFFGSGSEFTRHLQSRHPGTNKYSRAYLYAYEKLGAAAYDLFGPICFLALQAQKPGEAFVGIVEAATKARTSAEVAGDPVAFLFNVTNKSYDDCFIHHFIHHGLTEKFKHPDFTIGNKLYAYTDGNNKLVDEGAHPVLQPYLQKAVQYAPAKVVDFFARPYYYMLEVTPQHTKDICGFIHKLFPPLIVSRKSRNPLVFGITEELGRTYFVRMVYATALSGVVSRCYAGVTDIMLCSHSECPLYEKKLCHRWLIIPEDYKKCGFPQFLAAKGLSKLAGSN
jgi:hypothetical protein